MQGRLVLLKNYAEEMQYWFQPEKKLFNDDEVLDNLFHAATITTADLSLQALASQGLSATFWSLKNISIVVEEDVQTISKHGSAGLFGVVVFTANKCLSEALRFGFKSPGQALGTSQLPEAICRCYAAGGLLVAADASPQRSSSSESSSSSNFSFLTIRSPQPENLEPEGVVEDDVTADEVGVAEEDGENSPERLPLNIPIIERKVDGTEYRLDEMALTECFGYFTFAVELAGFYQGYELNPIPHVLWPWPGYSTQYMALHDMELDPRRIPWEHFSASLRYIVVRSRPIPVTDGLPIQFQRLSGSITEASIPWSSVIKLKSFVITVHMLWSGWRNIEPLDPGQVTCGNMVGLCFITFFDVNGEELYIPTIDHSLGHFDKFDSGDEYWLNEEGENDDNGDKDDGGVKNENDKADKADKADKNEEDGENLDEDTDEDDAKNFLLRLASIVVREGRQ